MLVQSSETVFTPFTHPAGVEAHYIEVAADIVAEREADEAMHIVVADSRIFDDKAIDFAEQEGMTWRQFVLRGLDIDGMHLASRRQGRELQQMLGLGHVSMREVLRSTPSIKIGIAYYGVNH